MKNTEMLNQIKTLLNIDVKLEEMKLENGTVITADSFEKDKQIFIVTDDEKVALPVGDYELEDGKMLIIETEGIISEIKEKIEEEIEEKKEEIVETEDLEDEIIEEEKEEVKEEFYATKEELGAVIDMIEEIKAMIDGKEDMSEEGGSLKSRTVKEEFSKEVKAELSEVIKEDLSQAAAKPIKHNPEEKSAKVEQKQYAKGKFNTTLNKVMDRISQINNK